MAKVLIRKGKKEYIPELKREVRTVKGKTYFVEELSKDFHTTEGIISKKDLKKKDGTIIKSNRKKEFVILSPWFIDKYKRLKKLPQTVPLKDLGIIAAETGVNKDSVVIDSGTGSSAMACFFANICKKVISYEIREEFIALAKKNIANLELKNITIKHKSIYEPITEKNADLFVLDVPEPWKAISNAKTVLKVGGYFVSYSPCVPSVQDFVNEIMKHDEFLYEKTIEVIRRKWEIEGRKVRPKSIEIGHSGFLTFVRKLR